MRVACTQALLLAPASAAVGALSDCLSLCCDQAMKPPYSSP